MTPPAFAVLAEDRAVNRLRVAEFSSASDLQLREVGVDLSLDELKHRLRGLCVIGEEAERLANALVPQGFVAFDPIDFAAFAALFSSNLPQPAQTDDRFADRARFV